MKLYVTSVGARSAGEEICVSFELTSDGGEHADRQSFVISTRQYLLRGVEKGESDTGVYDAVSHDAEIWEAAKRGMRILGYGPCSRAAMRAKLIAKGIEAVTADEAVCYLDEMGVLDERVGAVCEARRGAEKLWGQKRIIAALYEKGYSADSVNAAMNVLEDDGVDYVENCSRLIEKKYGVMPRDKNAAQKAIASLIRYGYSISEIKEAPTFLFAKRKVGKRKAE